MREADDAVGDNLVNDLTQGEDHRQTSLSNPRVVVRAVAYRMITLSVRTVVSHSEFAKIFFCKELKSTYRSWQCSSSKFCSGILLKMISYKDNVLASRIRDVDFMEGKVKHYPTHEPQTNNRTTSVDTRTEQ